MFSILCRRGVQLSWLYTLLRKPFSAPKARRTLVYLAELTASRARLLSHALSAEFTADSEESA